jgi:hypothetical protein
MLVPEVEERLWLAMPIPRLRDISHRAIQTTAMNTSADRIVESAFQPVIINPEIWWNHALGMVPQGRGRTKHVLSTTLCFWNAPVGLGKWRKCWGRSGQNQQGFWNDLGALAAPTSPIMMTVPVTVIYGKSGVRPDHALAGAPARPSAAIPLSRPPGGQRSLMILLMGSRFGSEATTSWACGPTVSKK